MKVTPKTEKEIVESRLLPKGWYPFTIGEAEDALSKAAKERGETEPNMIALNVQVYKDNGFVFVKDWLMDTEFGAHKLRHCADTCGILADYESGSMLASQLVGKEGYVKIGIQVSKGSFPDSNRIEDYATHPPERRESEEKKAASAKRIAAPLTKASSAEEDLDEVPF